jgi:hypothetical protein
MSKAERRETPCSGAYVASGTTPHVVGCITVYISGRHRVGAISWGDGCQLEMTEDTRHNQRMSNSGNDLR